MTSSSEDVVVTGLGATTPLGAGATQLYSLFSAKGHGGLDFSGIIRMLRGEL